MTEYLNLYREIAENLYPNSLSGSGISEKEIEQAESQKGFRLPEVLREFYLLTGNHEAINQSHNYLISVGNLVVEDNRIVFYGENQGVCYWGIDLAYIEKSDSPVWVGQSIEDKDELEWHSFSEKLSDFLVIMLCWQSVLAGLPFGGVANKISDAIIEKIKGNFTKVEVGVEYSGLQAYTGAGQIVCLADRSLYAAAINKEKFLEIQNLLEIEWNFSTLG